MNIILIINLILSVIANIKKSKEVTLSKRMENQVQNENEIEACVICTEPLENNQRITRLNFSKRARANFNFWANSA